jgi:acyl-coenzyme A thioesterase PaaI-like protein
MPADASVLTVEFKINLLAPARGDLLVAVGMVVKPGRTLSITRADVYGRTNGRQELIATLQQTLMVMRGMADEQT